MSAEETDIDNPLGIICWPARNTSDAQIRALLALYYRHLLHWYEMATHRRTVDLLSADDLVYQVNDGRFAMTGAGLAAVRMVLRCARFEKTREIALNAWGQKSRWVAANVAAHEDVEPSG